MAGPRRLFRSIPQSRLVFGLVLTAIPALAELPHDARSSLGSNGGDQVPSDASTITELDARSETPIIGYTYNAVRSMAGPFGAHAYMTTLLAAEQGNFGGGIIAWGTPIDGATLIVDAQRTLLADFSPSVAGLFHLLGDKNKAWSISTLGKFKVEGFSSGSKHNEIESEVEIGAVLSIARDDWHADVNGIFGKGLGDDGEADSELRLRGGYDVGRVARVGLDAQNAGSPFWATSRKR